MGKGDLLHYSMLFSFFNQRSESLKMAKRIILYPSAIFASRTFANAASASAYDTYPPCIFMPGNHPLLNSYRHAHLWFINHFSDKAHPISGRIISCRHTIIDTLSDHVLIRVSRNLSFCLTDRHHSSIRVTTFNNN